MWSNGHVRDVTSPTPGIWRRVVNLRALADLPSTLHRLQGAGSGTVRADVGPYPVAYVSRPESVRALLDGDVPGIAERGRFFEEVSRVLGPSSLVTCSGAEHRRLRKLLAPAFRPEQVGAYAQTMVTATSDAQRRWSDGAEIVLGTEMTHLTLDVAARALLGLEAAEELDAFTAVLEAGTSVFYRLVLPRRLSDRLWATRLSPANRRLVAAQARVDAFVVALLATRAARAAPRSPARPANLLDVLVAPGPDGRAPLGPEEIRDQVVTFLFAGHETTAQALTWAFVQLSRHPAVEEQLVSELDDVLGPRPPTQADLAGLRYTRAVVRETLRLFPPAWFSSREAVAPTTLDGCPLGRGTLVVTSAFALQRDPAHWSDPERFDPARWLGESAPAGADGAYLPFGHGRRNCIGSHFAMTELVLVLATTLRHWSVRVCEPERVRPRATVTLRPRRPVRARVVRRPSSGA